MVAVHQGVPIGAALACVTGERAWVMRIAIAAGWRGRGLASALLVELERRLIAARVGRIAYVLPEEDLLGEGLLNAGYTRQPAVAYFEKTEPLHGPAAGLLDDLGGRFLPNDLWAKVAGMEKEKDLIERRVVLPLAEPERAAAHGVRPPRAITLFGPPGTGKTTFARAIASRLGWPFVELLPSASPTRATSPPRCATRSPGSPSSSGCSSSSTRSRRSHPCAPSPPSPEGSTG